MSGCGTSAPTRGSRALTCPLTLRRSGPFGSWCEPPGVAGLGLGLGDQGRVLGLSLGAQLTSLPLAGHLPHQGGQGGLCHRVRARV